MTAPERVRRTESGDGGERLEAWALVGEPAGVP
jgi:hypothetical protein